MEKSLQKNRLLGTAPSIPQKRLFPFFQILQHDLNKPFRILDEQRSFLRRNVDKIAELFVRPLNQMGKDMERVFPFRQ